MRINRELGGTFKLDGFEHHAFYNRERNRIEMHLASLKRQKVKVAGETIDFRAGETIHTENSYKYSVESLAALARGVGWLPAAAWTDARQLFLHPGFHVRGRRRGRLIFPAGLVRRKCAKPCRPPESAGREMCKHGREGRRMKIVGFEDNRPAARRGRGRQRHRFAGGRRQRARRSRRLAAARQWRSQSRSPISPRRRRPRRAARLPD